MSQLDRSILEAVARSYLPESELVSKKDYYGLFAKLRTDCPPGNRFEAWVEVAGAGLELLLSYAIRGRRVLNICSGNLTLTQNYQKKPSGIVLTSRTDPKQEFAITEPFASLHYNWPGQGPMDKSLDADLRGVSQKLSRLDPEKRPETLVGISSRDMIAALALRYELKTYTVKGYDPEVAKDALAVADTVRKLSDRPACPDRNMYAVMIPTEEFIELSRGTSV